MFWMGITILVLLIIIKFMSNRIRNISCDYQDVKHRKQSQSVKYGQMMEQFMPFMEGYPYDSQNFKFLGKPIDGVQFNENEIVFIEFKIGTSQLNQNQKKVKQLVKEGKVFFEEVRI